jgi:inosine/xanthosine triphosphate pyrophosphatase family protein
MTAVGHTGLNNMLAAYSDKSAVSVCTFAYCEGPGHEPIIFQGRTSVSQVMKIQTQLGLVHTLIEISSGEDRAAKRSNSFW